MSDGMNIIEIGSATAKEAESNSHTPSRIQADTFFTFTSDVQVVLAFPQTWKRSVCGTAPKKGEQYQVSA